MTTNKFYFFRKVSVWISVTLLLPFVVLAVLVLLVLIFDLDCSTLELSILFRITFAYLGLTMLFFVYIISPNRNRCCGSTGVKIGMCLLFIIAILSLYISADIDISCQQKTENNNCEMTDTENEKMKMENQKARKLLLAIYSNSYEKAFTAYAFFGILVIEKTNVLPICFNSNFFETKNSQ